MSACPKAARPGRASGLPHEGQHSAGQGVAWHACHTEACVDLSAALLCQPVDGEEILAVEIQRPLQGKKKKIGFKLGRGKQILSSSFFFFL